MTSSKPAKPLMNLDEVEFDDIEDNGLYTSRRGTTQSALEVCEYPDSGKVGIFGGPGLRKMFRVETTVEYYDCERT